MVRPIAVPGQARPHEVLLLVWSLISGVSGLGSAPAPASLVALVPHWEVVAWSALLAVSGATGLLGCFWRRGSPMSAQFEAGGLLIGCAALVLYIEAILVAAGAHGAFTAGIVASWGFANLWRVAQLMRDLRRLRRDQ